MYCGEIATFDLENIHNKVITKGQPSSQIFLQFKDSTKSQSS